MPDVARPVLALVFTPGVTLGDWRAGGLLDRELRYYEALSDQIGPIILVSGGKRRLPESERIEVVSAVAALRARPQLVKTNQLAGIAIPLAAKVLSGSRIVARGGYLPSERWRHRSALAPARLIALMREAILCRVADLVIVTTDSVATELRRRHGLGASQVVVIPNFIDPELFAAPRVPERGTVTMIGRLTKEKNVLAAVDAVASLPDARLRLAGAGALAPEVAARVRSSGGKIELLGPVPHTQVPRLLATTDVFLLCSLFEGHPKSLLEAMAVGVPCVVTPSPGVASLVDHGRTGYVAKGTDAYALRAALAAALNDPDRERVGSTARMWSRRFARDRIVALESAAYRAAGLL